MTTAPPLIAAQGLGRRRPGSDCWLLRDVMLDIHGGDCLAIMGPTGAGKTLLLRALSLLDPLDAGHVYWQGRSVAAGEVPRYRRQAVYLHQRPTLIEGTVEQNLRLPYTLQVGWQHQFDRTKVLKFLNVLGRGAEFLSQTDHNLSGGERQIVAVVRALQLEPRVLLLDEPTAALDREATRALETLIFTWQREKTAERAFVWVSHSHEQIKRIASRTVSMHDGRLAEGGNEK